MPTPLEALDLAIGCFDSQEGFAVALTAFLPAGSTVSSPAISQWRRALTGGNPKGIPQDRCEPIETATGGRVRVEELRPDLLWKRDPEGHVIGVITPIKPTSRKRGRRRATAH